MEIYEKVVGSVLLVAGLAIIGYGMYSGINIFLKGQNPPELFKSIESAKPAEPVKEDPVKTLPKDLSTLNPDDLQKMVSGSINADTIKSLIPQEIFGYAPRLMNYSVFSIFLWVLIIAGGKISALGISLIKTNAIIKF